MIRAGTLGRSVAAVGVLAVGLAAALVVSDSSVVEPIARTQALSDGRSRALWVGLVATGCLLWLARTVGRRASEGGSDSGAGRGGFTLSAEDADELSGGGATVGQAFERRLQEPADSAATPDPGRDRLRSLAVDAVCRTSGCSRETALEAVRTGEWTDDRIAAAYLSDRGVSAPFHRRLRAWFRPQRTRRERIVRTVAAIDRCLESGGGH